MIDFEEDSPDHQPVAKDSLARARQLGELMIRQMQAVASAESDLAARKLELKQTQEVDLPDLLKEVGLSEIKMADGSVIEVKEDFRTSIPEGFLPDVMEWLTKRGFDGIVKTNLIIPFGREDRLDAELWAAMLREQNLAVEAKEGIHPQTLKSFVKEQRAAALEAQAEGEEGAEAFPDDLFGVYVFNTSKYTPPKTAARAPTRRRGGA